MHALCGFRMRTLLLGVRIAFFLTFCPSERFWNVGFRSTSAGERSNSDPEGNTAAADGKPRASEDDVNQRAKDSVVPLMFQFIR